MLEDLIAICRACDYIGSRMKYQSDFEDKIEPWGLIALIAFLLFLLVRFGGMDEKTLGWLQVVATFGLGIIGLVYSSRQSRLSRAQAEASLVIEVTPENVIRAANSGTVPINIKTVSSKTFPMIRAWATQEVLMSVFNNLHGVWKTSADLGVETVFSKVHENMRLSKDEKITLLHPQTGIKGPVELNEQVVQIISVIYSTDLDEIEYRKSIGVFRLTSPETAILWRVCQSDRADKVDFRKLSSTVEARGLKYNQGGSVYVETLRHNIDNSDLVMPSFRQFVLDELKRYDDQLKMNPDSLPQDEWIVYRIETSRV